MRLSKPAGDINLGAVVRATETDFTMVECFDPAVNQCRLSLHCGLKAVLSQAMQSYFSVLDGVTLADLVASRTATARMPKSLRSGLVPGLPATAH